MNRNFYLKHPLMAMCDRRMKNLVKQEGLKGTGAYWFILEILGAMPNQCGQFEDLRPFCKQLKISFAYIKKIILEYQLFSMDEEGNFEPEELNPPRKTEQKATKNTQEFDKSDAKNDENKQKVPRISTNPEKEESHKSLIHGCLASNTSVIKEYIKDITTTTTTEEKEETVAAADILLKFKTGDEEKPKIRLCIPVAFCDSGHFAPPQSPIPSPNRAKMPLGLKNFVPEQPVRSPWMEGMGRVCTASGITQVTVRNGTGHQPKPRSSVLTSCVIERVELRHFGCLIAPHLLHFRAFMKAHEEKKATGIIRLRLLFLKSFWCSYRSLLV